MRRWVLIVGLGTAGSMPAAAQAPDRLSAVFDVSGGSLEQLQATESGSVVVGLVGSNVTLLDLDRWLLGAPDTQPCQATAVAAHDDDADGSVEVAIGCEDGSIHIYTWNGRAFTGWRGGDQLLVKYAGQRIEALVWPSESDDGDLFAVAEASSGSGYVGLAITRGTSGYTDSGSTAATFAQTGLAARLVVPGFLGGGSTRFIVHHSGNRWSQWSPVSGAFSQSLTGGLAVDTIDLAPRFAGGAWSVSDGDDLGVVNVTASSTSVVTNQQFDVSNVTTMVEILNDGRTAVDSYGVYADDELVIQDLIGPTYSELAVIGGEGEDVVDLVAPRSGYVVGGTSDGAFVVFSDAPWIGTLSLTPDSGVTGAEIAFDFTSDGPGDWNVQVGGTRDAQPSGDEVASGSLSAAGDVSGTFTIPSDLDEGENVVWAFVEDPTTGTRGYAAASLTVDNAPGRVSLSSDDVGVGNGVLYVTLNLLDASDIDAYDLYVNDAPFSADDYGTGGPDTTINGVSYPREVSQPTDGSDTKTVTLSPLDNGTTYYIAIRARDTGGAEGPMSKVVSETPEETFRASGRAGDAGGCQDGSGCATSGGAWGALGGLLGIAVVRRRRRGVGALTAALLGALLLNPSAAQAQDGGGGGGPLASMMDKDITPAWVNVEASYGSFSFRDDRDDTIPRSFGKTAGIFRLEIGAQLFRYVEVDFGIGYMGPKGNTLTSSGALSAEEQRLKILPMNMAITGRIHVLDEQPIVPYARIGMDLVWYREVLLDSDSKPITSSRLNGSKRGWHWGAGANILLDLFMPKRASMLEAHSGINDTWLFVEYRQQRVNPNGDGFDFSGWNVSAGLKIDY